MIGFNKPHLTGKEIEYIVEAIRKEKISGNGHFTQACQRFLEQRYQIPKVLLTSSCTDALEMCALLIEIQPGDEVIMPSYTFVSTANAFVLRGASIVFADSSSDNPNINHSALEHLITKKTKAIVVVHYAGFCCDMDELVALARKHNLYLIEDAAQAIESTYKTRPLGSIGHLACFSFHETKNVISGEGGALLINDTAFAKRAEIIWEKGTNRSAFFKGEVDKYNWIDVGSSFLPSEITAAFLFAQLESIDKIQMRRKLLWETYQRALSPLADRGFVIVPTIPSFCEHNAHLYYLVCRTPGEKDALIAFLNSRGISAISHYHALHKSPFYSMKHHGNELPECDRYASTLLRLPIYFELTEHEVLEISEAVCVFFQYETNTTNIANAC